MTVVIAIILCLDLLEFIVSTRSKWGHALPTLAAIHFVAVTLSRMNKADFKPADLLFGAALVLTVSAVWFFARKVKRQER